MASLDGRAAVVSAALAMGLAPVIADAAAATRPAQVTAAQASFRNPLYRGADPWIVRRDGWYYLCQSAGRGIDVYKSRKLTECGERTTVWRATPGGWNAQGVWAPELHFLRGKWYIYYAASRDGNNAHHRMGVLESAGVDPLGPYIDRGMLYTGDDIERRRNNRWAIDGTAFELAGKLYFVWSGWADERDIQHLYIARMENPWTMASNRARLCANDTYPWERVGESARERGLHEGPVVLVRNGRVLLVYSCSGSWQPTYKLGLLWADAKADPMEAASWTKLNRPVFQPTRTVFGVGHCSFTKSPDGTEDWMAYHSKVKPSDGWERVVRLQRVRWTSAGLPDPGLPEDGPMPAPSGEEIGGR